MKVIHMSAMALALAATFAQAATPADLGGSLTPLGGENVTPHVNFSTPNDVFSPHFGFAKGISSHLCVFNTKIRKQKKSHATPHKLTSSPSHISGGSRISPPSSIISIAISIWESHG